MLIWENYGIMENFKMYLGLSDLSGAFVKDELINGVKEQCLVIPIKTSGLAVSKRGRIGIELDGWKLQSMDRYGKTHLLKQHLSKDMYDRLSPEDRKRIPIIGHASPMGIQKQQPQYMPQPAYNGDEEMF